MTTTKILSSEITLLSVVLIGLGLVFAGEVAPDSAHFAPPLAFILLRGYVVMRGKDVRERTKDNTARWWTWGSTAIASAYIASLMFREIRPISIDYMISLQAANIMLVGAEIYYSILAAESPSKIKLKAFEIDFGKLETEIGTAKTKSKRSNLKSKR